jgi:hypothetical protein
VIGGGHDVFKGIVRLSLQKTVDTCQVAGAGALFVMVGGATFEVSFITW